MADPLITSKRIARLTYQYMDNGCGCPSAEYNNAMRLAEQVVRETADACIAICDAEAKTMSRSVIQASITIRRRMGEG